MPDHLKAFLHELLSSGSMPGVQLKHAGQSAPILAEPIVNLKQSEPAPSPKLDKKESKKAEKSKNSEAPTQYDNSPTGKKIT